MESANLMTLIILFGPSSARPSARMQASRAGPDGDSCAADGVALINLGESPKVTPGGPESRARNAPFCCQRTQGRGGGKQH